MEQTTQRIVVKVGTSTLTHASGALDLRSMEHLVRTLADLANMGHEIILVTSGAIAVGTARLRLPERPRELRMKQAAAAVGQCRMMHLYDKLFSEYNRTMAQILLTGDDVEDPERSEHLRSPDPADRGRRGGPGALRTSAQHLLRPFGDGGHSGGE